MICLSRVRIRSGLGLDLRSWLHTHSMLSIFCLLTVRSPIWRYHRSERESVMRTVCGSEFQTDGAKNRKVRLQKSVLMNGWSSSGKADQRSAKFGCRHVLRFSSVGKPKQTCSKLCTSELPTCMWSTAGLAINAARAVTTGMGLPLCLKHSELVAVSG